MYIIAIIGDILSFIPGVNVVSSYVTALLLWMVGSANGTNLFSKNSAGLTFITLLAEIVPGLSMLPLWTIRVYLAKNEDQIAKIFSRPIR